MVGVDWSRPSPPRLTFRVVSMTFMLTAVLLLSRGAHMVRYFAAADGLRAKESTMTTPPSTRTCRWP